MYDVSITNNYVYGVAASAPPPPEGSGYRIIGPGESGTYTNWGNGYIPVPGMGPINFIDLGDRKLNAYTSPEIPWTQATWGGVVRYRGLDAYFRYEGQGKVEVVIDAVGSVSLHFPQGGMMVSLADQDVT
jgi:hypothetical protein